MGEISEASLLRKKKTQKNPPTNLLVDVGKFSRLMSLLLTHVLSDCESIKTHQTGENNNIWVTGRTDTHRKSPPEAACCASSRSTDNGLIVLLLKGMKISNSLTVGAHLTRMLLSAPAHRTRRWCFGPDHVRARSFPGSGSKRKQRCCGSAISRPWAANHF